MASLFLSLRASASASPAAAGSRAADPIKVSFTIPDLRSFLCFPVKGCSGNFVPFDGTDGEPATALLLNTRRKLAAFFVPPTCFRPYI
jgi:hypothetical protein